MVQAEFTEECMDGAMASKPFMQRWHCSSHYVLGMCVLLILVAAVISAPIWFFIYGKIGKRRAWLLWSLTQVQYQPW